MTAERAPGQEHRFRNEPEGPRISEVPLHSRQLPASRPTSRRRTARLSTLISWGRIPHRTYTNIETGSYPNTVRTRLESVTESETEILTPTCGFGIERSERYLLHNQTP